jgi:hypothetical protein
MVRHTTRILTEVATKEEVSVEHEKCEERYSEGVAVREAGTSDTGGGGN